jgi:DNA-binding CsgD family transcriptional regulator
MNRKRFALYSAIVALGFLWTGSSYISQMYRLQEFFPPGRVDVIVLRWNYLAQAGGIAIYAVFLWRKPAVTSRRSAFIWIMLFDAALMVLTLTSAHQVMVLWAGLLMNLLHGSVAGAYLTMLGGHVPKNKRGRAFGFAYAAGSLGTYFLSLIADGQLIRSSYAPTAYLLLIGANIFAVQLAEDLPAEGQKGEVFGGSARRRVFLLLPALVLMAILSSVGSHYQFQAVVDQNVSLELSRAFYAVSLIAAGIATDINRKMGALLCLASLAFPFVQVALLGQPSLVAFAWGLSYFIKGFYAVYRAVCSVDIAGQSQHLLPLAGLGLCAGRIGEALGTLFPETLLRNLLYSTILVLALFVPITFLFFFFFQETHEQDLSKPQDTEVLFQRFEEQYALTKRESEVLRQIIMGLSNGEISAALYISESTVKFHVKNILKKTGCVNRAEVISRFRQTGV